MKLKAMSATGAASLLLALTACASTPEEPEGSPGSESATAPPSRPKTPDTSAGASEKAGDEIAGAVIRFSTDVTSVDVTIDQDNPAVRDFMSMLPLTLTFEEYAGEEKISYLPRKLDYEGSPGSALEQGDLLYFVPWGNIGFWYSREGSPLSDQTIHLGTYDATLEQLEQLEGERVTVAIAD
ncbi:cyclophilin-like fold protein [Streptomyces iakyrus]|uniref:cyclophilin-like fold protein n=1 Tax=Streptomyces iakyrus TaxID=68219 RepID=UPI0036EE187E